MAKLETLPVTYASDGSASYTTKKDDVVGLLCRRHYGYEWNTTEAVLEANPGLAEMGPLLPDGVVVLFPVMPDASSQSSTRSTINLYDD